MGQKVFLTLENVKNNIKDRVFVVPWTHIGVDLLDDMASRLQVGDRKLFQNVDCDL